MRKIREIAAELPEEEFYAILDGLGVQSLDRIASFEVFQKLANAMHAAAEKSLRNHHGIQAGVGREQRPFFFEVNYEHHPVLHLSSSSGLGDRHRSLL
jgi:hypothetical protein